MSEASSSHTRILEVINFHAANPTASFTLSEVADKLGLSLGSAHRILNALVKARYLTRHPKHKTYSLGVALVAIGHAALEKHRGVDIARRELARLTEELKVQCIAAAVVDGELLLLAKEGTPQTHEGLNRIGDRRPFMPPFGLTHIAWNDAKSIDAFLATAPATISASMRAHLDSAVKIVRRRGYAVAANGDGLRALRAATLHAGDHPDDATYRARVHDMVAGLSLREAQLLELTEAGPEGISYISAPVFSPLGDVALELTISGMPYDLTSKEIQRYAERLRAAAAYVTSESHGRMPT